MVALNELEQSERERHREPEEIEYERQQERSRKSVDAHGYDKAAADEFLRNEAEELGDRDEVRYYALCASGYSPSEAYQELLDRHLLARHRNNAEQRVRRLAHGTGATGWI